jgi:hypothetical protein
LVGLLSRRIGAVVTGASLLLQVGCYAYRPTEGAVPATGTRVALRVNDAGRVALGGAMGPEIDQVEGVLIQKDSVEYVLAVSGIHTIRGGGQGWSGEKVHIRSEFVTGLYERRLDKKRTIIASAIGLGVLLYVGTRVLKGSGILDPATIPPDSAFSSRRLP